MRETQHICITQAHLIFAEPRQRLLCWLMGDDLTPSLVIICYQPRYRLDRNEANQD